jgi:YhcH/YjgK/YiaL family protein
MIVATLEECERQAALTPRLRMAFEYLRSVRNDPPTARVALDCDRVYALPATYETRSELTWTYEAHRTYIDIHYVVNGGETIGCADLASLRETTPYDSAKDAVLGQVPPGQATLVRLMPGQAAVLYPTDAHSPGHALESLAPVLKVIVKVAVG